MDDFGLQQTPKKWIGGVSGAEIPIYKDQLAIIGEKCVGFFDSIQHDANNTQKSYWPEHEMDSPRCSTKICEKNILSGK